MCYVHIIIPIAGLSYGESFKTLIMSSSSFIFELGHKGFSFYKL